MSRPLEPIATGADERLQPIPNVRCVLFDVYGTLLVSGSGEVGTLLPEARSGAFLEALQAMGIETEWTEEEGRTALATAVTRSHQRDREAGVEFPEVDIVEVWRACLESPAAAGRMSLPEGIDHGQLALEYELRTNPVWPMPGAEACLLELRERGMLTGIISNAQFFTPRILEALLPKVYQDLDLGPDVQYYSYQHRQAKPGAALYEMAQETLAATGLSPSEVLYVGNDMLNDIWPASRVGFRTALFAGDRRSLRLREGDERVLEVTPDLVVTSLASLAAALGAP